MTQWQEKALQATKGTQFGAIIHEALRQADKLKPGASPESDQDRSGPRFIGKANVTSDGFVMCDFVDRNGNFHHGAFVGAFGDLTGNVAGLSDHLSLTSQQRQAFRDVIKAWVGTDWRVQS